MIPYYNVTQKSPEWHRLRALHFTASEFGPFCLEPRAVNLSKEQIVEILEQTGMPFRRNASKADLLELVPDVEQYETTTPAAMTAILKKIQAEKVQRYRDTDPCERTEYEQMMIDLADEVKEQKERQMAYNIAVRRGNALEPEARFYYEERTGRKVEQIGFIAHDGGGFGCSPDGIVWDRAEDPNRPFSHYGLEIKCPMPEAHMAYLLGGGLPDEYLYQAHGSMAVTGFNRWDFLSYCPGEAPLLLTIERDDFTDRLEAGLKQIVAEKRKVEVRLAEIWDGMMNDQILP